MKILYLPGALKDLVWFTRYYTVVFAQGRKNAVAHYRVSEKLIADNPFVGKQIEGTALRKLMISKTPFSIAYKIQRQEIIIHRIIDQRSFTTPDIEE